MKRCFLALLLCAIAGAHAQNAPAPGQAMQSPAAVQRAVEDFLRVQTSGLAGQTTFTTGTIDPRLALPACGALDVFMPPGGKLWGNSSVGVRCGAPTPWSIYVSVTVRVKGAYVAASRAIAPGQSITQADVTIMQGDLTQLPPTVVTDLDQVLGKTLGSPLSPGQPLRADALRVTPSILQGQTVRLVSQGPGFRVTADGKALANAVVGQLAQVRTAAGQTVSGVAQADGTVEVKY
jgi:flagella basal body P-ring formation protein FlgA